MWCSKVEWTYGGTSASTPAFDHMRSVVLPRANVDTPGMEVSIMPWPIFTLSVVGRRHVSGLPVVVTQDVQS